MAKQILKDRHEAMAFAETHYLNDPTRMLRHESRVSEAEQRAEEAKHNYEETRQKSSGNLLR